MRTHPHTAGGGGGVCIGGLEGFGGSEGSTGRPGGGRRARGRRRGDRVVLTVEDVAENPAEDEAVRHGLGGAVLVVGDDLGEFRDAPRRHRHCGASEGGAGSDLGGPRGGQRACGPSTWDGTSGKRGCCDAIARVPGGCGGGGAADRGDLDTGPETAPQWASRGGHTHGSRRRTRPTAAVRPRSRPCAGGSTRCIRASRLRRPEERGHFEAHGGWRARGVHRVGRPGVARVRGAGNVTGSRGRRTAGGAIAPRSTPGGGHERCFAGPLTQRSS